MSDIRQRSALAERAAGRRRMAAVGAGARRVVLLCLTVAVVVACAACDASGAGTAPGPAPAPTTTPASVAGLHLPLDAYALSDTQEAVDEYLGLFLEHACMAKLGFSFLPGLNAGYAARDARAFVEFDSRLWGISNPAQARLYGYHLPPWAQQASNSRPHSLGFLSPGSRLPCSAFS